MSRALTAGCSAYRTSGSMLHSALSCTRPLSPADVMANNMTSEELVSVFGDYLPAVQADQSSTAQQEVKPSFTGPPAKWPKPNGEGQGHGQGHSNGTRQRQANPTSKDGWQVPPDRACPRSSPAVSSTGGLVELAEARPLVPPVLPHPRHGDHVERALRHLNSMEIPEGCRQHGVPAEDCPVQVRHPRTSLQSGSGGGGPGESCRPGEEGMAHQGRRQRTLMGSTRVGPEQPERRGGIGDGAAPAHGRLEGTGPDHGGSRRHHPSEISLHEASRPVLQRRDGPVFDGDIQPQRVHRALVGLCCSALWFLVGARLKVESLRRSPLAQRLIIVTSMLFLSPGFGQ